MKRYIFSWKKAAGRLLTIGAAVLSGLGGAAQAESAKEDDYFKIMRVPAPEGDLLEVGGLCTLPNGNLAVTTRRGDVFIVENPSGPRPFFRKFASGMHEVLGVAYKEGSLYCAQRGELTRLTDTNNDGKADNYETVFAWPISGNYHEYSFGPKIAPDGKFFVTLNLGFPDVWWHPQSFVPWRGWTLKIGEDGSMEPWAAGMRSPCGISMINGELFYTDNQGDWVGSGSIMQVKKGAFMGHPASLVWTGMPGSPLQLKQDQVFALVKPRNDVDAHGKPVKPENIVQEKFLSEYEVKKAIPELQLPAVWLPHGILGVSNSEIVQIPEGHWGPFGGQLLVGDQGMSKISRVFLEKIGGEYQGAAIEFRSGFQSGVTRMAWGADGSLFAGETARGWGSAGDAGQGLQRLVWNGRVPFEMRAVRAMPDGFEIEFTRPAHRKYAEDPASYRVESYIYKYHSVYGSPPVNQKTLAIKGVRLSPDGLKARIVVEGLRPYYVHTLTLDGIRDAETSFSLVHPTAYYTLNHIPEGNKLSTAAFSKPTAEKAPNKTQAKAKAPIGRAADQTGAATPLAKNAGSVARATGFDAVKPLLAKHTCLACHNTDKKQVGPAYRDVAKRKYSIDRIVQLIHTPEPQNWPEFATPMPPMPQVPVADARKIAAWINSLK